MKHPGKFMAFFLSFALSQAYASGDGCNLWCGEYPNAYFITPANDSRGNLGLILEDQGIVHYAPTAVPFHYAGFTGAPAAAAPAMQNADESASLAAGLGVAANSIQETSARLAVEHFGRCLTDNAQAIASLFKALQISNLPVQDTRLLAGERMRFAGLCEKSLETYKPIEVSDAAKPYARYLEAAAAFYSGQYDRALALFQALSVDAKPVWVQETSLYMLGRVALNQAQSRYDGWSDLNAETIDRAALGKAASAFDAYLKAFPQGRYAESARGLFRKIHWLSADGVALTADYQAWQMKIRPGIASQALLDFINETESKSNPVNASVDVLWAAPLLAMQHITASWRPVDDNAQQQKPVGLDEINAHRSQFADAGLEALWSYLTLAHRYWVGKDYTDVLQQTASDAIKGKPSNVVYSRWVLHGLALMALQRWPEAEAHWQSVLKTVEHSGQKNQAQLLLALVWRQQGALENVYAKGSLAGNNDIQEFFVHDGKPELLASLLKREDLPSHTRSLAYFTLVNQFVRHRDFKAAGTVLSSYPASGYALARDVLTPLAWAGQKDDYACPSFNELLTAIQQQTPAAAQRLNCMGDFLRTQNWDYPPDVIADDVNFGEGRLYWHALADYGLPFKDKPTDFFGEKSGYKIYSSLDYYMDVINRRGMVAPEDMAYALHRATHCFASSGNNHCGNQDIPKTQRAAWFKRLKSEFKGSRWAKEQKYYW
jgi:hypothetical protein